MFFSSLTILLTLIFSKNALLFLWKTIIFFLFQGDVVISAWLLLMQFNLILLETSYSYICLIIQQLIGIFHNCWYEKDKKKYSSPYIPWFIRAGHESRILNLENVYVSRLFPSLYGREAGDSGTSRISLYTKLLMVVPRWNWLHSTCPPHNFQGKKQTLNSQ